MSINMSKYMLMVCLFCLIITTGSAEETPIPTLLKENGGWCWYQDERAIVDSDQLIFGSVASPEGHVEITTYNFTTNETQSFVLHERLQSDDHNVPALLKLPDGNYLAVYAKHGSDHLMRWRITQNPGDISVWSEEQTLSVGAGNTYSNLFQLSGENHLIYNFHRGIGWNPNYMLSEDDGKTWRYGGRLLQAEGRPYVKYASNNLDTIHFITTEHHPHNFPNSIYHAYIRNGVIYHSDGSKVSDLSQTNETSVHPSDLTQVFAGDDNNIAWTTDLHLDQEGFPYIVFSIRKNQDITDHRYYYGRWDGEQWQVHEMAYAGSNLYDTELDYTGLVALYPNNPDVVYLSADVHPKTGEALISDSDNQRHYEIFTGITQDNGKTWDWTAITQNSSEDQLRPIVPKANQAGQTMLIWLTGEYRTYTDYDLDVVGLRID